MSRIQLKAKPTHIRYYSSENGFLVMSAIDIDTKKYIKLTGMVSNKTETEIHREFVNETYEFFGDFQENDYGLQFKFNAYLPLTKSKTEEIYFFLSRFVPGISEKNAKDLINYFGESLEEIIVSNPQKMEEVKGIKSKKIKSIIKAWQEKRFLMSLTSFLGPFEISNNTITHIFQTFGQNAQNLIEENPYVLTKVKGLGFKKADEIARKLGVSPYASSRIKACIIYIFKNKIQIEGHCFLDRESVKHIIIQELATPDLDKEKLLVQDAIQELVEDNTLIAYVYDDIQYIFLRETYIKEAFLYEKIISLQKQYTPLCEEHEALEYIKEFEKNNNMKLSDEQNKAVLLGSRGAKCFAIAGSAGTGKTSVSKCLLGLFEKKYGRENIICCALSGVATARIRKQSGYSASTIHSLLAYDIIKKGFTKDENDPLDYAVILLDEASMVDNTMFYALMKAIDFSKTHLILLGDNAQLPPIGHGDFFNDVISYHIAESVKLSKVFRQDNAKGIAIQAGFMREGKVPTFYKNKIFDDFFFIPYEIPNYWAIRKTADKKELERFRSSVHTHILEYIKKAAHRAKEVFGLSDQTTNNQEIWGKLASFQIIAPQKEGPLGVKNLNLIVQKIYNPPMQGKESIDGKDGISFRQCDKVIHLQNKNMDIICDGITTTTRVFNGQIGIIKEIDTEKDEILVYYPNENYIAIYESKDFRSGIITLAYAISIHKSQGSEFDNVIIPITMSNANMLNTKLLYTALTRAKHRAIFVGESYAFEFGCKKKDGLARKTLAKIKVLEYSEHKDN